MQTNLQPWDYLIVTASNDLQSSAYGKQLALRTELGLLSGARYVLVVPDPDGRRVGSAGSTIACLLEVLNRELPADRRGEPASWLQTLQRLRVLIVHAGGDSQRLPAYGPCGKIFIPMPVASDSAVGATLFDCQLPRYLALPAMPPRAGQVVITSGDVLLEFEPSAVRFAPEGLTGLAALDTPQEAADHGVFVSEGDGRVRFYLQKPSPQEQADRGAIDRYGRAALDIGVMNFDAATACRLVSLCQPRTGRDGGLGWSGAMGEVIQSLGLDFYREICCAMGTEASFDHYAATARSSGSKLSDGQLRVVHDALRPVAFTAQTPGRCGFLHFGTTRQLLTSGAELVSSERGVADLHACLEINTEVAAPRGRISGPDSWVEGTRVRDELSLAGRNVVVGVDVDEPLALPEGACLDVLPGKLPAGKRCWFVRCYGDRDTFKAPAGEGGTLVNLPLEQWLSAAGAGAMDVWDADLPAERRRLWNARVFPAVGEAGEFRRWLWMFEPAGASDEQRRDWLAAERFSMEQMALLTDAAEFFHRRDRIRSVQVRQSVRGLFRSDSDFSAAELAYVLRRADAPGEVLAHVLAEGHWHAGRVGATSAEEAFALCRILHTAGSAVAGCQPADRPIAEAFPSLANGLQPAQRAWLDSLALLPAEAMTVGQFAQRARAAAFERMHELIGTAGLVPGEPPRSALREDEIAWGRAPARLDLAGGWTDTPPYSLERGGRVVNAAVNLNGQPPIHCYARVIPDRVIRIASIDLGQQLEIRDLDELLDYRQATSGFALAKAALALSGFSPEAADWKGTASLADMLDHFGGGLELTTLAAIPKGSGLGTSSIVGAVILAVVQRVMGRTPTQQELFHGVLRMEQALTTGGGWQDQVGGVVDRVKLAWTEPGLVPQARIHYVPADVLDPRVNGGRTLLYYTGITRLAKNILHQVVGRYLDRDRAALATLERIGSLAPLQAEAMARKDLPAFGALVHRAWELNKALDPASSNEQIEGLLKAIAPHSCGAKLLGAGGGGFLLIICPTVRDAQAVREKLQSQPPNPLARFFDIDLSTEGLVVTVC